MSNDTVSSPWEDQVVFQRAFSHAPANNHIARAYHAADMYHRAPPSHLRWLLPAISVPANVHVQIDAEQVTEMLLGGLASAESVLARRHKDLDVQVEHVIHHGSGRNGTSKPYQKLYPDIAVTRASSMAWRYTFNPYEVGRSMIQDYTRILEGGSTVRLTGFTKVARLHQQALAYEMSVLLITDAFRDYR